MASLSLSRQALEFFPKLYNGILWVPESYSPWAPALSPGDISGCFIFIQSANLTLLIPIFIFRLDCTELFEDFKEELSGGGGGRRGRILIGGDVGSLSK